MTADIIVINWNGRDDTLRLIAALAPQLTSRHRLIIVDNGSTDGSSGAFRAAAPNALIVQLRENRGFTGGIAAGVEASTADSLILLNNDAIPETGWLENLVKALDDAPADVAAVGGKIVDLTGALVDFVGGAMTFDGHAFQFDFRRPLGKETERVDGAELLFACGGNMIVRRDRWNELGGFDDDYFAYLEDVDFGWRCWSAGYRVRYARNAVVRHRSSATSDKLGNFERGVLFEKNAVQTIVKNVEEELFAVAMAPVLLAMLHRLHRYTVDRSDAAAGLADPPLGEAPATARKKSTVARIKKRLRGEETIDPLARMQFRATEWFLANSEKIMMKRTSIQSRRQRSDAQIFARFPLLYVPTYHGDDVLMSSALFRALRTHLPSTDTTLADIMQR